MQKKKDNLDNGKEEITLSGAVDSQTNLVKGFFENAGIDVEELPDHVQESGLFTICEKDETEVVEQSENGSTFVKSIRGFFKKK